MGKKYLPAPILAPFLSQDEAESLGVPPANLDTTFTPRLVNPAWLVSLRLPCLTILADRGRRGSTVFTALESLTVDSLLNSGSLEFFGFPVLRQFSASLAQGCQAVAPVLSFLESSCPVLRRCDLNHRESKAEISIRVPGNLIHFGVKGCVSCSLRADLHGLRSVAISVSSRLPLKFPAVSERTEKIHADFRMVWRPSLEFFAMKFPCLKELRVTGPVFGDAATVLASALRDTERFPCLRLVEVEFLNTKGSPLEGFLQENRGHLKVVHFF